jgi:putative ATPase
VFWGPPGSGKTTLAQCIAAAVSRPFVLFSAVAEGVPRLREIMGAARERIESGGPPTILFVDEIHRLNSAQQDVLLPPVESGLLTLIGATTENPSFALNGALLSRVRVFVLEALDATQLRVMLDRALADHERGIGNLELTVDAAALDLLIQQADGDARRALTLLDAGAQQVGLRGHLTVEVAAAAAQRRMAKHDKTGEEHFNILSAYHKSLRGSDPQGALYWMARWLDAGDDPLALCRRAVAVASEDIGLADSNGLLVAIAARDAFRQMGPPEGYLALAHATIYLATAPKSNRVVLALHAALAAARETPAEPVPIHLRNAPTALMKELGYGAEYRYPHDFPGGFVAQAYLPEGLSGRVFYEPGDLGAEKRIAERLAWWAAKGTEQP